MPIHGGLTPGFERYGGTGQQQPVVQRIVSSLTAQLGTAFDVTTGSNVYGQALAYARAIAEMWSNNTRMANQWDAQRMTNFLPRWETIFGLYPLPTDTAVDRRNRVATAILRIGVIATTQVVKDTLTVLAGANVFLDITHTSSTTGPSYYAGSGFTNPYGSSIVDWWSNVLHIAIKVQQPSGMTNGDFANAVGRMAPYLDSVLPAWVTWSTYSMLHSGAIGFWLDETNLEREAFRI